MRRATARGRRALNPLCRVAATLVIAYAATGTAVAANGEAWRAYLASNYTTALRLLRPAAEAGNADAQYRLGTLYRHGQGVPRDPRMAADWWTKAAQQGNADAAFSLGFLYYRGADDGAAGVPQDLSEAGHWLLRAAEGGSLMAQYLVGQMYRRGDGLPRDPVLARRWSGRAAQRGHVGAQFDMGLMLAKDWENPDARVECYQWFALAARHGYPGAAQNLAKLEAVLPAEEIARGRALADRWRPTG
jgi:TPR repeat protein